MRARGLALVAVMAGLVPVLAGCSGPAALNRDPGHVADPRTFQSSFDSVPAGRLPSGWSADAGAWGVVDASDAPSPQRALQASPGEGPARLWLPMEMASEFELVVKVDTAPGAWVGVILGRFSNGAMTVVRVDPGGGRAELVVVRDGVAEVRANRSFAPLEGWHAFGVAVEDGDVALTLDGQHVFDVEGYPDGSRIGLWAEGGARFDDLSGETE